MRPFRPLEFAAASPTIAQIDRVEPNFVTVWRDGRRIAASSSVVRRETPSGAIYLFPRADVETTLGEVAGRTISPSRVAFDPATVKVMSTPARGAETCWMI